MPSAVHVRGVRVVVIRTSVAAVSAAFALDVLDGSPLLSIVAGILLALVSLRLIAPRHEP